MAARGFLRHLPVSGDHSLIEFLVFPDQVFVMAVFPDEFISVAVNIVRQSIEDLPQFLVFGGLQDQVVESWVLLTKAL